MRVDYDGTECSLKIVGSKLHDEGNYECFATNDAGKSSSSAMLIVNLMNTRPTWKRKLADIDVVEGQQARFVVSIKGHPNPKVVWYKGATKITESPKYHILELDEEGRYCLTINNAVLDDAVSYKCVATNEVGSSSSRAMLNVRKREFAPEFDEEESPKPVIVQEGQETNMVVTVRGYPKPDITWYKSGSLLYDSRRMGMKSRGDTHTFVIYRVTPQDADTYKCEAYNSLGRSFRLFDLNVKGKKYSHFYIQFL